MKFLIFFLKSSEHRLLSGAVVIHRIIQFLDRRLKRDGGLIQIDIYRKPTDARLCIPADSNHLWRHRVAAFESALHRMWALPLPDDAREQELDYINRMAILNG